MLLEKFNRSYTRTHLQEALDSTTLLETPF